MEEVKQETRDLGVLRLSHLQSLRTLQTSMMQPFLERNATLLVVVRVL